METAEDFRALSDKVTLVGQAVTNFAERIDARVTELEQKAARRGPDGSLPASYSIGGQSLGSQIVANAGFRQWLDGGKHGSVRIPIGALPLGPTSLFGTITSRPGVTGSAAALVAPDRQPDIVMLPQRRLAILDLLSPGRTTSRVVLFAKETVFTDNAGMVSEGSPKPESDIQFEATSTTVKKVAHFIRVSKEALDDAPSLQATIDSTLRYGVALKEEMQLLYGSGVAEDLFGLVPQATAYAAPFTPTAPQMIDQIALAITQSETADLPATGIILNTKDWRRMMLLKDTQERYLGAGPFAAGPGTLWGLPVAYTNSMTFGHFLVGAFGLAAQIFDREDAIVLISSEDAANFTSNLVTILAEERLALVVRRPQALITGAFSPLT